MDEQFKIKDSGQREEYDSGMKRDTESGKPDYTLCWEPLLTRWAEHMTKGAEKYGRHNWQKANSEQEFARFRSSAFRHLMQWLNGDRDEDHAAAVIFNLAAAEYVREILMASTKTVSRYRVEIPTHARPWSYGGCVR